MSNKIKQIHIRIDDRLKAQIQYWAKEKGQTVSEWIRDEIVLNIFAILVKCPKCSYPMWDPRECTVGGEVELKCNLCGQKMIWKNPLDED